MVASHCSSNLSYHKQLWRIKSVKGYRHPLPPLQKESLTVDDGAKATAFQCCQGHCIPVLSRPLHSTAVKATAFHCCEHLQSIFTKERLEDLLLQFSLVDQSPVIDSISFTPNNIYLPGNS